MNNKWGGNENSRLSLFSLFLILISCGGSGDNSSPVDSVSQASSQGTVTLALIRNARVRVYDVNEQKSCNLDSLPLVGNGTINEAGHSNVMHSIKDGTALFVVSGGSYMEEASNLTVNLTTNQSLHSIASYEKGVLTTRGINDFAGLTVSAWSHLQAGYFCHLIEQPDITVAAANEMSTDFITKTLFDFDPRFIPFYRSPTNASNNQLSVDAGLKLGFANAGLSELSMRTAQELNITSAKVTSLAFAQLFYKDIYRDGLLDGNGISGTIEIDGENASYALGAETYGIDLPQAIGHFYYENPNNQVKNEEFYAKDVFRLTLDTKAPQVFWDYPEVLGSIVNITFTVQDPVGVAKISLDGPTSHGKVIYAQLGKYYVIINTSNDGTGLKVYNLTAVDFLGNRQTYRFLRQVINAPPQIQFLSTNKTANPNYTLVANIHPVSDVQEIARAECSSQGIKGTLDREQGGPFSCSPLPLSQGENLIIVSVCDQFNHCAERTHRLIYDSVAPSVNLEVKGSSYQGRINLEARITDNVSAIKSPVRWIFSINDRERERGEAMENSPTNYSFSFDSARYGSGEGILVIQAADEFGNKGEESFSLAFENRPASVDLLSPLIFNTENLTVTFAVEENSYQDPTVSCFVLNQTDQISASYAKGTGECVLPLAQMQDGEEILSLRICSSYNLCRRVEKTITKDTVPPVINITFLQKVLSGVVNITFTVRDSVGVAEIFLDGPANHGKVVAAQPGKYYVIINTTNDGTGLKEYNLTAVDLLGNRQTYGFTRQVINAPPKIQFLSTNKTADPNYTLVANIRPVSSVQEIARTECSSQGIKGTLRREQGGSFSCSPLPLSQGENLIIVSVCDQFNHCAERTHRLIYDSVAPSVNLEVEGSSYQGIINLEARITDNVSAIKSPVRWIFSINDRERERGEAMKNSPTNYSFSFDSARYGSGEGILVIQAEDEFGNIRNASFNLAFENRPASVDLLSSLIFNTDNLTVTFAVEENSYQDPTVSCFVLNQTNQISASYAKGTGECVLPLAQMQDGEEILSLRICSRYNLCRRVEKTIKKDTVPPVINITFLQREYSRGSQVRIVISDRHSAVNSTSYQLNDGGVRTFAEVHGDDYIFPLPASLPTGQHTLSVRAIDELGNEAMVRHDFVFLRDEPILNQTSASVTKENFYTLTASLDSQSYQGSYTAYCRFGLTQIPVVIQSNMLSCVLDLSLLQDGNYPIEITLTPDYDRTYEFDMEVTKDTTAPFATLAPHFPVATEFFACAPPDYDNIPLNCTVSPTNTFTDLLYDFGQPPGELTNPNPFPIEQQHTTMELSLLESEDLAVIEDYDFVGITVQDDNTILITPAANLNVTYDYAQILCAPARPTCDHEVVNDLEEAEGNVTVYFENRSIPYQKILPDGNQTRIIIPFTNEFLNTPAKPLWVSCLRSNNSSHHPQSLRRSGQLSQVYNTLSHQSTCLGTSYPRPKDDRLSRGVKAARQFCRLHEHEWERRRIYYQEMDHFQSV